MEHVYWAIKGKLAGRTGPLLAPWDLDQLCRNGVRVIVTLNEEADSDSIIRAGLQHHRFALPTVLILTEQDMETLMEGVEAALMSVVLPAPLGPTIPTRLPSGIVKSISQSTGRRW